ncbi:restriction endonuclease [Kineococcus sp. NBC_00420]|uniref:restriction endonuclease n=1 Tax=Kineococcus sp. NBC_00420 TaxID=2903564 RepID=UPI002E2003EE
MSDLNERPMVMVLRHHDGMTADALDTEYENGVADVLAYLGGDSVIVARNRHLPGRLSGRSRQIDVLVTGSLFGSGAATMVVDCKRYSKKLDVNAVGTFVSLVEDVGADIGLLVTTVGVTSAAREYAANVRGIRLDILSLQELAAWAPRGTINFDYAVPSGMFDEAVRAARRAGFRVVPVEVEPWRREAGVGLSAFQHTGTTSPSGDVQEAARESLLAALSAVGVSDPVPLGNGLAIQGGTPAYRWLDVTLDGRPIGLKILAADEKEVESGLDSMADEMFRGTLRESLDVVRPEGWPTPPMFPNWS